LPPSVDTKPMSKAGIKFHCTACGRKIEVLYDLAGTLIDCPSCQKLMNIPVSEQAKLASSGIESPDGESPPLSDGGSLERNEMTGKRKPVWLIIGCLGLLVCFALLTKPTFFRHRSNRVGYAQIQDSATDTSEVGDYSYRRTTSGTVTIVEYQGVGNATIPDVIDGRPVTSIESDAFDGCKKLTHITIPNSVTNIGDSAFSGCTSLTSVTIPNSVTMIGDSVFSGCTSLSNITLPNSITNIGDSAFADCKNLTVITIPPRVISIGDSAFSGCTSLTNIAIPSSVTSMGEGVFDGCKSLTDIKIPTRLIR